MDSLSHQNVIEVFKLHKKFCRSLRKSMQYSASDVLRQSFGLDRNRGALRSNEFWALKNINFSISKGESIGLMGANGSGKTTLLKIISGLIKPDNGGVRTRGRIIPLFAKGAGFNSILSGRENIFVNLALLGLTDKEIEERLEQVIDFADLPPDALEAPVKSYSSGMAARLGFSCAINTKPDILIIDEALAVGDMKFRAKCYRKLSELRSHGTSFIMVSHSLNAIISNCDLGIYLANGETRAFGPVKEIACQYEEESLLNGSSSVIGAKTNAQTGISQDIRIHNISFNGKDGQRVGYLQSGLPGVIEIDIETALSISNFNIGIIIKDLSGELGTVVNLDTDTDGKKFSLIPGRTTVKLDFPVCVLRPGVYDLKMYVSNGLKFNIQDAVESHRFQVKSGKKMVECLFYQPREWFCEPVERF